MEPCIEIQKEIARLVRFALSRGLIEEEDRIPATNALLDALGVDEPYAGELNELQADSPTAILGRMLDYAAQNGLLPDDTTTQRDLFDTRLMGLLTPRQSEVSRCFRELEERESAQRATDYLYGLSIDSNYIRMDRIRKNEYWLAPTPFGDLEITINLSKPEKDPKEIAAERSAPRSSYPKCLLCVENVGYAGRINHPARQNLRVVPVDLAGSRWYFQYSPYVYYNEHSIIFSGEHTPMRIGGPTFVRLLEFVGRFGHYFIGSNADLPIVGGSILSHDHFQGGRHAFPMEKAALVASFTHAGFPGVKAGIVNWPMSVIRIAGRDRTQLAQLAERILDAWRAYSDAAADIIADTVAGGERTPHNTITPIARRNAAGEYELDLVLRNNRTTEEHPAGLFHPHAELHHIKKENIGLIEVMGLAVLPGRLKEELEDIVSILCGEPQKLQAIEADTAHPLHKHAAWIRGLLADHPLPLAKDAASQLLRDEVGRKFAQVLADAGVYKLTDAGLAAFAAFMAHLGFVSA